MPKKTTEEKIINHERAPIIVVMGHIDHGKTTLLDFIREAKVAEKETGGITQHIGAYEAEHKGKKITFLDTPGHAAFGKMRLRGVRVADIAILVVSAEEGIKQQTKEAIAIIKEAGIPFVVAINKIDKPNADPARTKKGLAENDVLVEEYGGKIPAVEISAKTGKNVDALLDTLLIASELEELKWNPDSPATGVVVESHVEPRRGKAATLLVRDGVLRKGEFLVIQGAVTPIRVLENFRGEPVREVHAAMPAVLYNLSEVASLGAEFQVFEEKGQAEEFAAASKAKVVVRPELAAEGEHIVLNIVLKTDVLGSKEAIEQLLEKLQFAKVGTRVLKSETGDINESDVKLAGSAKNTIIVGFRVKIQPVFQELAASQNVLVITRDIIYEIEDELKKEIVKLVPAEIKRVELGQAKILALFKKEKGKQIVGGEVLEGIIKRGAKFDIERNKTKIGLGTIHGLQQQKKDADEVKKGLKFGVLAEASIDIAEGDTLYIFGEEEIRPSLS